ncbi:hypothetical protein MRX96_038954 [Rhipicephalus microplus]
MAHLLAAVDTVATTAAAIAVKAGVESLPAVFSATAAVVTERTAMELGEMKPELYAIVEWQGELCAISRNAEVKVAPRLSALCRTISRRRDCTARVCELLHAKDYVAA